MNALILFLTVAGTVMIGVGIRSYSQGYTREAFYAAFTGGAWIVSAVCLIYLKPYVERLF
jgi:hypothetical protein